MARISLLSLHTSPLAQPGTGDSGGMNVYVRELAAGLAHAGNDCRIFVRTDRSGLPARTTVEPGVTVEHVPAGPVGLAKEDLVTVVDEWADAVASALDAEGGTDVLHSNYWLSGVAGHRLKHLLDRPLVSTFHTLARVKAEAADDAHGLRARAEADVIGCSDAILANSPDEAVQLERLYSAVPDRIEIVPPGVDHGLFFPGDRNAARVGLGLGDGPVLLFVGRIQPLKGADVAVRALAALTDFPAATLVLVGGASGPEGPAEMARLRTLVVGCGVADRVRFVPPQPHGGLADYYRAADVCLVPSRSESFGLVALEAAACGTPVVAAAVGGLRSLVAHTATGFLVEGRDPADFAAYAGRLLAEPALAAEMGGRAAASARRYRWSITAARLRRVYADLTVRELVECR